LVVGWLTGTFGLFGTPVGDVTYPMVNYFGFFLACLGMVIFGFVKPEGSDDEGIGGDVGVKSVAGTDSFEIAHPSTPAPPSHMDSDEEGLSHIDLNDPSPSSSSPPSAPSPSSSLPPSPSSSAPISSPLSSFLMGRGIHVDEYITAKFGSNRKYVGFAFAVIMGIFFGTNYTPTAYLIHHACDDIDNILPRHGTAYIFSQYIGILLTSIVVFVVYSIATKNSPHVNPDLAFPAILSGLLWGVSQFFFFIANTQLGLLNDQYSLFVSHFSFRDECRIPDRVIGPRCCGGVGGNSCV
jgi:hypothetical protein